MIYLVIALTALSVVLLVVGIAALAPGGESRVVRKRLAALQEGPLNLRELRERRRRQAKREQFQAILAALGDRVSSDPKRNEGDREMLIHAGYRHRGALSIYVACRLVLAGVLGGGAFLLAGVGGFRPEEIVFFTLFGGFLGFIVPFLYVARRRKNRQKSLERALPDVLDLLVVCVEAGLGLNQALLRVSEEIERVSPEMGDELALVNMEMRAGRTREEALKNFADRTGVTDIRALITMMIQTDRFGTSIADSLRVHSDELRTKRAQRAEEAAAKTAIKMLIPLVLFIFPAIFVITIGPAVFHFGTFFGVGQ